MRLGLWCVGLIVLAACGVTQGKESSRKDFEEFCQASEGRWICDVTWVSDWPGVGKKGETVRIYNDSRVSEDGNALIEKLYRDKGTATRMVGYDAGAKQIRSMMISSGGYVGVVTIHKESDGEWVIKGEGSEADGTKVNASLTLKVSDRGNTRTLSGTLWSGGKEIDVPGDVWRRVSK